MIGNRKEKWEWIPKEIQSASHELLLFFLVNCIWVRKSYELTEMSEMQKTHFRRGAGK